MSEKNSKKRTVGDAAANLGLSMTYMLSVIVASVLFGGYLYSNGPVDRVVLFVICSLLVIAGVTLAVATIRSIIRLALEMRKEYCFDCNCKQEAPADKPSDDIAEFQRDPNNPDVLIYPMSP